MGQSSLAEAQPTFIDVLKRLPCVEHVQALELLRDGEVIATVKNEKGSSGALAVLIYICRKHGAINRAAANEGLDLFCEHTAHAQANPGRHKNIDRLLEIIENNTVLHFNIVEKD